QFPARGNAFRHAIGEKHWRRSRSGGGKTDRTELALCPWLLHTGRHEKDGAVMDDGTVAGSNLGGSNPAVLGEAGIDLDVLILDDTLCRDRERLGHRQD